jgi:hypothetical protein
MFDAVVVSLAVESVANRSALVVRLKENAPVHCALTSSLSSQHSHECEKKGGDKRASSSDGKGRGGGLADDQVSKRNKGL